MLRSILVSLISYELRVYSLAIFLLPHLKLRDLELLVPLTLLLSLYIHTVSYNRAISALFFVALEILPSVPIFTATVYMFCRSLIYSTSKWFPLFLVIKVCEIFNWFLKVSYSKASDHLVLWKMKRTVEKWRKREHLKNVYYFVRENELCLTKKRWK